MWHGGPPLHSGRKNPGEWGDYALEKKRSQEKVKITRTFLGDIATNYLPHIYSALRPDHRAEGN
jgi:hypothetical protein